jgi:hypothetical protein
MATDPDRPNQPDLTEQLRNLPPPAWIEEMRRFFQEHGYYRPEDLRRLLGDPTKGVTVGLDASLPDSFHHASQSGDEK